MNDESSEPRAHIYDRLIKYGLIGSALAFGLLIVLVILPVNEVVGGIVALVGVFALLLSAVVMIVGIAARDLPEWRQNRWRFSLAGLFNVMLTVTAVLGSIVAAEQGVSLGRMLLALGIYFILATILYSIYINWSRIRHFNAMNSQGRYLDWNRVAAHAAEGEGTILLSQCYRVPTVWWSEKQISTMDEARAAIDSDAVITFCPKRTRVAKWLQSTFPSATVVELDANAIHTKSPS